jgi:uncharacterized membrane protein YsdA (DUF1294 family)/cold shock CspA family protein
MKRQGQLVRWESTRGFGFIRSPDIPADVFVHLRDFVDRGVAPQVGMALQFEEIHVGGKGPRAVAVQALGATLRRPASPPRPMQAAARRHAPPAPERARRRAAAPASPSALPFLVPAIGYATVVGYGVAVARIPAIALGVLLLVSLLTFFVYGFDKNAAETGRWRTPESTLHLLSLIGGWPGAWCAQRLFRHKVRKASFMTVYWATVLAHIAAVAAWVGRLLPAGLAAL